jgi:hypothetical protein
MWGEAGPRPAPDARNAELFGGWSISESVVVAAAVDQAWALIAEVTRMGEFSPECVAVRWTRGSTPSVGNTFEGTNLAVVHSGGQALEAEWTRPCTITRSESERVFAYTVGDRFDGTPASEWEFELSRAQDGGCRIVQTFRHRPDGLSGIRVQADADPPRAEAIVAARTGDLAAGMRETLARIKQCLEGR